MQKLQIEQLKRELHLCNPQKLQKHTGLSTGVIFLDDFLAWKGLPRGELSLFTGDLGLGATSLWLQTAQKVLGQGRWAAWMSGAPGLFPLGLRHRHIELERLLAIEPAVASTPKQIFWLLQELISANLFELIACDLSGFYLHSHHWRKLLHLCRRQQVACVFFTPKPVGFPEIFSLILEFKAEGLHVLRARHRPTPFLISRRWSYAHLMCEFNQNLPQVCGRGLSQTQPPGAVSGSTMGVY